tara:strand:- start:1679 stop:2668 length:990 start_codon:yes stop_codon:yes gene_type:complete
MKALVTGGCGFIGSHLSKKLIEEGFEVEVVDDMSSGTLDSLAGLNIRVTFSDFMNEFFNSVLEKRDIVVIQGDFASPSVLDRVASGEYDYVFHQAAIPRVLYSVENPSLTTNVNILGTVRLLEACRGNVKRVIMASSSSVYGGADVMPTSESCPKSPKSPYAWQKSSTEDIAKIFSDLYGLDIACLRYFNVFGPGQLGDSPYSTAIAAWCHSIKEGRPLRSDGDGEQSRDLCYIENVVNANILAATTDKKDKFNGDCYNIACGHRTSNNQILDFLRERFDNLNIVNAPERQGDVKHTLADISLAYKDFEYKPTVLFWDGLKNTLDWWGI